MPELLQTKRLLDMHMVRQRKFCFLLSFFFWPFLPPSPSLIDRTFLSLQTMLGELMDNLRERKLDDYYQAEEELMNKKALTRPVQELLADADAGTALDRCEMFRGPVLLSRQRYFLVSAVPPDSHPPRCCFTYPFVLRPTPLSLRLYIINFLDGEPKEAEQKACEEVRASGLSAAHTRAALKSAPPRGAKARRLSHHTPR